MNLAETHAKQKAIELSALYNSLKDDLLWIIVRREAKNSASQGEILKAHMPEDQARNTVRILAESQKDYFIWAMHAQNYFTPYFI